jgi:hypothetical protein
MTLMGIDCMGPIVPTASDGSEYILLGIDYFSRFVLLQAVRKANGYWVVTTFMMVWSCFFRWPEEIYYDNSSHFKNDLVRNLFAHHRTRMTFGPVSHLASTGLPEQCVRLVRSMITQWSYIATDEELRLWLRYILKWMVDINTRHLHSTRMSPSRGFIGFNPSYIGHPGGRNRSEVEVRKMLDLEESAEATTETMLSRVDRLNKTHWEIAEIHC